MNEPHHTAFGAESRAELRTELHKLRPALYHRLHGLLPFFAHPLARRLWKLAGWLVLLAYFAFAALILTLRYSVLPNIEHYRGDIEQMATQALGLPVRIGGITAAWDGLQPDLALSEVTVADAEGRPALAFSRIEAILNWSSLARRQLRLSLLAIDEPVLHIRRDTKGGLQIAGIPVSEGESDANVADWVLAQKRIRINGATLVWEDELRAAPPLILEDLNLAVDNDGSHHRFGLTALPPEALAARIDIRGNLHGDDLARLDTWKGQLFAELDYVDLAGWHPWFDYPVALPKGKGAMRAWLSVEEGRLLNLTTDLALSDVRLRLAKNLPELRLTSLNGRLGGRLQADGFAASAKGLSLGLEDGTQVPPTDFSFDWQAAGERGSIRGSGTASRINLQRLSHLAAYLPLDANSRKLLHDYAPTGEIADLRLSFAGNTEQLKTYALRGRFSDLGLRAQGYFPGFFGISGNLEASEKGGSITLNSQHSGVDLPSVFPEPRLSFDTLSALVRWKIDGGQVDIDLAKVEFAGHDAAGSAQGRYRLGGDGPGTIDLTAALTRARGDVVWRYMPHSVGDETRQWLRRGITRGNASEAKLTLKGDLSRFPFLDGSGTFLVTAKARDVALDYAPGWPVIEHIDGTLRFAGAGMRVDAQSASLFGTRISATVAEIDDFDAANPLLTVHGKVEGPTADFFRYINTSPVSEMLERATSDMSAVGNGKLDLSLKIPLAKTEDATLEGDYQFVDNQVTVDPALPPMTAVNGLLHFTDAGISVREITGQFLGGPVKMRADTQGGRVEVLVNGSLSVAQARKHYALPVFDNLSGSANWRAEVKVKKNAAEIVVDSTLAGISSSLPPPFNKTATDALPLRFDKGSVAANGGRKGETLDRIRLSIGKVAAAQLLRRRDAGGKLVPERGALVVGVPLVMPETGLVLAVSAPAIDLDFWRAALTPARGEQASENDAVSTLMPNQVAMTTASMDAAGVRFHDFDLRARRAGGKWLTTIASQEMNGSLEYDSFGRGALRARLKNFAVGRAPQGEPLPVEAAPTLDDLPALDVLAEDFSIGKQKLGRLEIQAHNAGTNWRIEKLSIINPDGNLEGTGAWRMQSPRRFDLDFKLGSENVGGLLDRLGYPGSVKRGSAKLSGELSWIGVPTRIDYPSLTGAMRVDASNGQFAKMDPGAAGKLLGLISLQGLPRRISLDFRDVFSEGFAFDSISGKTTVKAGIMHTDRLQIDGPAARVLMRGDVDLQNETTKLVVNIQPELGGTAALGVALINPIAGAATLLAHKVFQSPLNHIFSFDYSISGKLDDPKVEKLSTQRLDAQTASDGEKREQTRE
ncbi:MAG: TIGR02099 family protein [Betaproteobacteria bacterium]|nr:TIGR02099 family protein [Betaproteobacteria bacterium]